MNISGNSTFSNNSVQYGGGVFAALSNVSIGGNSTFIDNSARNGGGIYIEVSSVTSVETPLLVVTQLVITVEESLLVPIAV